MGPNPPQVNANCDVVMKLSVFGTRTDTHTGQNLYNLALRAEKINITKTVLTFIQQCSDYSTAGKLPATVPSV